MTTHDAQTSTGRPEREDIRADIPETRDAAAEPAREEHPASAHPAAPTDDNTLLFADEHLSGLRSRWNDVQAAFVDDPKECVQKADSLVAEVVEELHASFADTRSRLEAQWARGEDASTEDLRLALKRYRDFFQRLLSV
jgi:hypothetical protein